MNKIDQEFIESARLSLTAQRLVVEFPAGDGMTRGRLEDLAEWLIRYAQHIGGPSLDPRGREVRRWWEPAGKQPEEARP